MNKEQRRKYNADWQATSCNIRIHRAGNKCEVCKIDNEIIIKRFSNNTWRLADIGELGLVEHFKTQFKMKMHQAIKAAGLKKVILSVAHLNHNEKDDRPENLLCGCQWCHLKHDRADNWMRRKRHKATQMTLFDLPQHNTHQNATQQQP